MKQLVVLSLALLLPALAVADCKPAPSDEHVRFSLAPSMLVQLPLGSSRQFQVGESRPPGPEYEPLGDVCAQWRIDPPAQGVAISNNGLLTVSTSARPDETFEVLAKLRSDREVRVFVHIYDKAQHPLAGRWKQEGGQHCPAVSGLRPSDLPAELQLLLKERVERQSPIKELVLRTDGWFTVTWEPFETYVDYAGKYRVEDKHITFTIDRGNWKPKFFQGNATFRLLDPKHLEVSGAFLGNKVNDNEDFARVAEQCEYVFVKVADPE